MIIRKVCILGGTGFVGHRLAAHLTEAGYDITIPTSHFARHRDVTVLPKVRLVEGDVHNLAYLRHLFGGMDAVVNLVGILNEKGNSGKGFERAHVELPSKVVQACRDAQVRRLLHMSALNAATDAPSHYLRTKAQGEAIALRASGIDLAVTSFRPSVIFGPHDSFINRFAQLLRLSPVFPLACPNARFQPVYVEDVARAFIRALTNHKTFGQNYGLCGPKVYTLREIVDYLSRLLNLKRRVVGLNDRLSWLQAAMLQFFPGKPFSLDNYRSLQRDSVCTTGFPLLFGVTPTTLEDVVPTYLGSAASMRLSALRIRAGR